MARGLDLFTVERLRHWVLVRHRHDWSLLLRFGLVGGSGVVVNLLVTILLKHLGPHFDDVFFDLPLTQLNVRWYHVYSMIAFLTANLGNYELNRRFTFRNSRPSWWRGYGPFLAVGLGAQVVGLGILTLLMHPGSPFALPSNILDNSTGLRTKLYWGQLIVIAITVPVSFVLNKIWTFSAPRNLDPDPGRSAPPTAERPMAPMAPIGSVFEPPANPRTR